MGNGLETVAFEKIGGGSAHLRVVVNDVNQAGQDENSKKPVR
jgi:hypothetical protein